MEDREEGEKKEGPSSFEAPSAFGEQYQLVICLKNF